MDKLRVLDLFSGIGGFSLGLERTGGFETVAFCEIEEFPRRVLRKHWPEVPVFEDVRTLKGKDVGPVDVVCGGYPCQGESVAGKREGVEADTWLWPEMHRLVDELRPSWVVGENTAGHISLSLDIVLDDLEASGYTARAFDIPAAGVGAPQYRHRVWIVAHTKRVRRQGPRKPFFACDPTQGREGQATKPFNGGFRAIWRAEPNVGRVAHGIPRRVDRLRALGNAVVPQIPEVIGHAILEAGK